MQRDPTITALAACGLSCLKAANGHHRRWAVKRCTDALVAAGTPPTTPRAVRWPWPPSVTGWPTWRPMRRCGAGVIPGVRMPNERPRVPFINRAAAPWSPMRVMYASTVG